MQISVVGRDGDRGSWSDVVVYFPQKYATLCAVGGVRHPQHTQTGFNSSTIAADSSNGVTNTRCCRYSCMRSWWWAEVPPETCRAVSARHPQHTQTGSNSSTIAADSSNGVTNTRCCRYSFMRSWWLVEVPPETCRAVSVYKLCNFASSWIHIGIYLRCTYP